MQTIKRFLSLSVIALVLASGAAACGRTGSPATLSGSSPQSSGRSLQCVRVHLDACWGTNGANVNGGYFVPPSGR